MWLPLPFGPGSPHDDVVPRLEPSVDAQHHAVAELVDEQRLVRLRKESNGGVMLAMAGLKGFKGNP